MFAARFWLLGATLVVLVTDDNGAMMAAEPKPEEIDRSAHGTTARRITWSRRDDQRKNHSALPGLTPPS